MLSKTGCSSGQIYAVLSEDVCAHIILSSKFMQIFADDQVTFCIIVAFSFTSCCNSNVLPQFGILQYNSLNAQWWLKFQGGVELRETIWFLALRYDFQDWKVLTSIPWRHSHMKFSDGFSNKHTRGPSQLSTPLYSLLIFRIYAATNVLGGGAKTDFVAGRRKP